MADVVTRATTLSDSVNVCLGVLGETPLTDAIITGANPPVSVTVALETIEETSREIQSKGWWFNTSGDDITIYTSKAADNDYHDTIPEEAIRYITIRAARALQTRFIGNPELHQFTSEDEVMSLALLQRAHIDNTSGLDFTSLPDEIKQLGVDEFMFLQSNMENKLMALKLATEVVSRDKIEADKVNVQTQSLLISQQTQTEIKETAKREAEKDLLVAQELKTDAETTLTTKQGALVDAQELKTDAETTLTNKQGLLVDSQELKTDAEKDLLVSQKTQLDAQTAITVTEEKAFFDAVVANTQTTYQDRAAEFRMMGIQEKDFYALPAYKKKESISDADKLRTAMATETGTDATEISIVNNIRRMIGERPITALNGDSMASEAARMLRKTSTELQGRGWWFNTEVDVEFTADSNGRLATAGMLSVELNEYDTRIKNVSGTKYLYDLKEKSHTSFSGTYKGTVIYERDLNDIPQKFQEYLEVRVAILLTEMYPREGIDIRRLPRIEKELEAYFKDRQNDEANYNILDSYSTASRVGINRNYDIV